MQLNESHHCQMSLDSMENQTFCYLFCVFIAASGHTNANISYFELHHIDVRLP